MPSEETITDVSTTQAAADTDDTTKKSQEQTTTDLETSLSEEKPKDAGSGLPGGDDEGEQEKEEKPESEDKEDGAPEDYGDFDLSSAEDTGYQMNDDQLKAFSDLGKENGFSKEQMQNLLNFDIERFKAMEAERVQRDEEFIANRIAEDIKATRQQHGENYSARYKKNGQVYEKFFPEDLRKFLNDSGISSMPGFFNALHNISQTISEDVIVKGDGGGNDPSKRTLEDFFKKST